MTEKTEKTANKLFFLLLLLFEKITILDVCGYCFRLWMVWRKSSRSRILWEFWKNLVKYRYTNLCSGTLYASHDKVRRSTRRCLKGLQRMWGEPLPSSVSPFHLPEKWLTIRGMKTEVTRVMKGATRMKVMLTIFSNDSHVSVLLVAPVLVQPARFEKLHWNPERGSQFSISHCHTVHLRQTLSASSFFLETKSSVILRSASRGQLCGECYLVAPNERVVKSLHQELDVAMSRLKTTWNKREISAWIGFVTFCKLISGLWWLPSIRRDFAAPHPWFFLYFLFL